jgi:hypothetical protein
MLGSVGEAREVTPMDVVSELLEPIALPDRRILQPLHEAS